jgi:hydrogenase nickel incorporation protein HypA/HybF
MHELSIAEAIVAIADRHAAGRRVSRVEVRVGHLRQVVPSALEFAFELVARDTAVEGAELVLDVVPARGRCRGCGGEGPLDAFPLTCRACGGWDVEVIAGEELHVESLDVEEEEEIAYDR